MKIVLDTNIWLSAIFWDGEASKLVRLAEKKKIEILITKDILSEIVKVLNEEAKFQKFLKDRNQKIEDLTRTILAIANLTETRTKLNIIKSHSADNIILEAALDGRADYIISYNNHVLNILEFRGIKIMNPTDFLKMKIN